MSRYVSLVGEKFNRLTVIEEVGKNHYGIIYKCKCDCGVEKEYTAVRLRTRNVQSCGCLRKEVKIPDSWKERWGESRLPTTKKKSKSRKSDKQVNYHGLSKTRLYRIFQGMKKRCYNKSAEYYPRYGGRGIAICDEWLNDFKTFYDWAMTNGYEEHLSIERKDIDGNYEPSNCTWIEIGKQALNRSNVAAIEYEGKTYTIRDLALKIGINEHTLAYRLRTGWSLEDAINVKPDLGNSYLLGKKTDRDEKGRFV